MWQSSRHVCGQVGGRRGEHMHARGRGRGAGPGRPGLSHPGGSTPASGCAPTASTPTCRAGSHAHRTCGGQGRRDEHFHVKPVMHDNQGSSVVAIRAHQSHSGLISRNQGSSVAIRTDQSQSELISRSPLAPVDHKFILARCRPSISLSLKALCVSRLDLWGGRARRRERVHARQGRVGLGAGSLERAPS